MEMTYDGLLVMPSNYAVMDEEEMIYVEGGISSKWETKAGKAAIYYTSMYWSFAGLACTYVGTFAALGYFIGGGLGSLIGGSAGMATGSIIWGFANACNAAAAKAEKYNKDTNVRCVENLNKRLVLSISVKKI